jgi:hypothetical protein
MVKETQKLNRNGNNSFKQFLEQSTSLKDQMKRTLDPRRHDWKTLSEYAHKCLQESRITNLLQKYLSTGAGAEKNEKNKNTSTGDASAVFEKTTSTAPKSPTKMSRKEQHHLMQQQQSKSMHETLFGNAQPRGKHPPTNFDSSESTFSDLGPQQQTPEEQIQGQQMRVTHRGGIESPRSPRRQNYQISNAQPSSDDFTIAELREEIEILNREKNVLELENNHLKSENFNLLRENEKLKRNNERLLKVQDTMVNLQQKQQQPQQQNLKPSVWGQHLTSIPSADDSSSLSSYTTNNGFGSNEAQTGDAFEKNEWLDSLLNEESTSQRRSATSIPPGFQNFIHTPDNVEGLGGAYKKTLNGWGQPA